MDTTINFQVTLIQETCLNCSGVFAVNRQWLQRKRESGGSWYCPYCQTGWHASETENMRLEAKLKSADNRLATEKARHDQTKASLSAQKGVTTRLKNRVKNGVCPCCNRHFKNLHSHMKNQHPDFEN